MSEFWAKTVIARKLIYCRHWTIKMWGYTRTLIVPLGKHKTRPPPADACNFFVIRQLNTK